MYIPPYNAPRSLGDSWCGKDESGRTAFRSRVNVALSRPFIILENTDGVALGVDEVSGVTYP